MPDAELTTRRARPDDHPFFARLFPELGVPDAVPSAERFAQMIVPGALLVCDRGVPAGYAWGRARGDRYHVVHVIVDPGRRRRGVTSLAARARADGFTRRFLHVKPKNVAARALYERCGMRVEHESVSMRIAWTDVARLAPRSAATVLARAFDAADDARFERALGAPPGELGSYRALGRVVVGVEGRDGASLGFAALDDALPGASPFRVRARSRAAADRRAPRARAPRPRAPVRLRRGRSRARVRAHRGGGGRCAARAAVGGEPVLLMRAHQPHLRCVTSRLCSAT